MSGLICKVRAQFPGVSLAQNLRTEAKACCQERHIITILWAVSLQFRQNQILGVEGVKVQVLEPVRIHLAEPRFAVLRQGNGRDMLKI
jgi:hypothetical protein